jgi:hypothetical protein
MISLPRVEKLRRSSSVNVVLRRMCGSSDEVPGIAPVASRLALAGVAGHRSAPERTGGGDVCPPYAPGVSRASNPAI